jgi:hypothetical protein
VNARIVTTTYRYKRPPRRKKPVALDVPAVVRASNKPGPGPTPAPGPTPEPGKPEPAPTTPANDDGKPAPSPAAVRKSAIVTVRRPSRFGPAEDLAPEEVRRRADAADTMMKTFKRQITDRLRRGSAPPVGRKKST